VQLDLLEVLGLDVDGRLKQVKAGGLGEIEKVRIAYRERFDEANDMGIGKNYCQEDFTFAHIDARNKVSQTQSENCEKNNDTSIIRKRIKREDGGRDY
jgi:hypothetical protein